jgi:hypothetical protein
MKHRVFAGLAVLGAALLVLAEFSPVYEVVLGDPAIVRRSVNGADNHSYALLVLAALALPMALGALRGARAAALALVALGAAALLVSIAIDLPDTRASGRLPESVAFEDARARAATGLYLQLVGGGLLIVAGGGLLACRVKSRARPLGVNDEP